MKTKYDNIFRMFADTKELSTEFHNPFQQGGYFCAGNSTRIAILKTEACPELKYAEVEKLKISSIITADTVNEILDIDSMKEGIAKIPLIDEYESIEKECDSCEGTGEVACRECGQESECDSCRGTGKRYYTQKAGKLIPNEKAFVSVNDLWFHLDVVLLLIRTAEILKEPIIIKFKSRTTQKFSIGKMNIYCASLNSCHRDNMNIIHEVKND